MTERTNLSETPNRACEPFLALLGRLAERGSRIEQRGTERDGRRFVLVTEGDATAAPRAPTPVTALTAAEIASACAAGLIEAAGEGCWRITRAGRRALRRARALRAAGLEAGPDAAPDTSRDAGAGAARGAVAGGGALPRPGRGRVRARAIVRPTAVAPGRNEAESPLAWLRRRRDRNGRLLVEPHQYDAGERLRADLWFAQMTPRVTAPWTGVPSDRGAKGPPGAGMEMADRIVAARQRVSRAMEAVGPELAGILIDVCGHLRGLEEIERSEGWPQRSAKLVLQTALNGLARHYGLLPRETAADTMRRRLRHWGSSDYRPSAGRWGGG